MSLLSTRRRSSSTLAVRTASLATAGLASLALASTAAASSTPTVTANTTPNRSSAGVWTLYGEVNPNGASSTTKFEIGTSTSYGISLTAQTVAPNPPTDPTHTSTITANTSSLTLTPGVTYHYRADATNVSGTGVSADHTFVATFKPSGYVRPTPLRNSDGSYQLNAEVNPAGLTTTTQIWFGRTGDTQFGINTDTLNPIYNPGGTQSIAAQTNITALVPGATYNYHVEATNSLGTFVSPVLSWTPTAKPVITTGAAPVRHSDGTYTLSGNVNPAGLSTTTQIWLGTSTTPYTYGPSGPTLSPTVTPGVAQPVSVDTDFTSLTPGVTYHYRTQATNSLGTTYGPDQTFVAS